MNSNDSDEVKAVGWDAIDAALAPLYGNQEPKHYGTILSFRLGGKDPLQGISAYSRNTPIPHWHFITYGFSDLYEKTTKNEFSGYGFELTFRLKREAASEEPPMWALSFLQNLARYVFSSGNFFDEGHYMNANGPIALGVDTLIHSIAFIRDPEFSSPLETPNGRLIMLQVVGITNDEEASMKQWDTLKTLHTFQEYLPLLITDLDRQSLLNNQEIRSKLELGARTDGSSTGLNFVENLEWDVKKAFLSKPKINVTLGAHQLVEILRVFPYRLPFGRKLSLYWKSSIVDIMPGEHCAYSTDDSTKRLTLTLHPKAVIEIIGALKPVEGNYPIKEFPGLMFQVKKSYIKDKDGKVIETVG